LTGGAGAEGSALAACPRDGAAKVRGWVVVARSHAPRMFTERGDAGVCFKTNPLVETEVVERANGPTELGAEGG